MDKDDQSIVVIQGQTLVWMEKDVDREQDPKAPRSARSVVLILLLEVGAYFVRYKTRSGKSLPGVTVHNFEEEGPYKMEVHYITLSVDAADLDGESEEDGENVIH